MSQKEMTSRERVLAAARLQTPDRVPIHLTFEWKVAKGLREYLKTDDLNDYFGADIRFCGTNPTNLKTDFSRFFSNPKVEWDEWGRGRIWDDQRHYARYLAPLETAESITDFQAYPWPDLDSDYRYIGLKDTVEALHTRGLAVGGALEETVFEIAWQLRTMERLFVDMVMNEDMAAILLDKITESRVATAEAYAKAGVDILDLGDDIGMQTGLMMSPDMYRQWLKPRLAKVISSAKEVNPEILVWYHSDGKVNDLIADLIDAGIDILNPVQPECVDHKWVKDKYGDRLAFSGGLGVQSVIPFGTPEKVKTHVKETIEVLGKGGGFIIGPSHVIERDTPYENIFAMVKAMKEFGKY